MTIDCDNSEFIVHGGIWDGYKLYDLYKEAYTPWEWQAEIKDVCDKVGIDFFSTPFDRSSVDFLESIGVEFYKIASYEFTDIDLIEYVASKHKPIVMSCGMATREEIGEAIEACKRMGNNDIAILKCTLPDHSDTFIYTEIFLNFRSKQAFYYNYGGYIYADRKTNCR